MICHIHPYRYCCPRCSSRTCSLPCTKRHKQWASCNGIRDRAAYVKRCDLATPKAIDHDYNYLTSIERQLDNAERDAESRGINLYFSKRIEAQKRAQQPAKGQMPLEAAIRRCRVVVDKAPKGMSRQKQNNTHWDRRAKCVVWTVEWVHENGSREIAQCPDSLLLDAAYTNIDALKITYNGSPVVDDPKRPWKKRKRNKDVSKSDAPDLENGIEHPTRSMNAPSEYLEDLSNPHALTAGSTMSPNEIVPEQHLLHENPAVPSLAPEQPPATPLRQIHCYLLLPSTPTSYRVLIPLTPSSTLSTALTDHLVLEFPTIYALKQPPDRLPTGFMTEEEYLKGLAKEGHLNGHLDTLLEGVQNFEYGNGAHEGEQNVNEGALRDVLKKDLITVVDTG
ncbi:MAG: hypothetical protein Q9220_001651 [cf. Caloplaca sp. 1 TL-2023]